jgi:hypothetical protein
MGENVNITYGLEPIKYLHNLIVLHCNGNHIKNIKPLINFHKLLYFYK